MNTTYIRIDRLPLNIHNFLRAFFLLRLVPIENFFIDFGDLHPQRHCHISKCRSFANPEIILDEEDEASSLDP